VDPDAAEHARIYLADAKRDSGRLGQQAMCGSVKVSRVATGLIFPTPAVPKDVKSKSASLASANTNYNGGQ